MAVQRTHLPVIRLAELLEERDGVLYWRATSRSVKAGQRAGGIDRNGYVKVQVDGRSLFAHRIIFAIHHGWWPDIVDHADGNHKNNRIENLRAATPSESARNCARPNRSGIPGVAWNESCRKWQVQVRAPGKARYRGVYDTLEEAAQVSERVRREAHGDFSVFNRAVGGSE